MENVNKYIIGRIEDQYGKMYEKKQLKTIRKNLANIVEKEDADILVAHMLEHYKFFPSPVAFWVSMKGLNLSTKAEVKSCDKCCGGTISVITDQFISLRKRNMGYNKIKYSVLCPICYPDYKHNLFNFFKKRDDRLSRIEFNSLYRFYMAHCNGISERKRFNPSLFWGYGKDIYYGERTNVDTHFTHKVDYYTYWIENVRAPSDWDEKTFKSIVSGLDGKY